MITKIATFYVAAALVRQAQGARWVVAGEA